MTRATRECDGRDRSQPNTATQNFLETKTVNYYAKPCIAPRYYLLSYTFVDASKLIWTAYSYSYMVESFEKCAWGGARAAGIMNFRRIN
jgi:hypothetical protein